MLLLGSSQLTRDQNRLLLFCQGAQLTRDEIGGIGLTFLARSSSPPRSRRATRRCWWWVHIGMESRSIRIRHLSSSALLVSNPNLLGWNHSRDEFSCTRSYLFRYMPWATSSRVHQIILPMRHLILLLAGGVECQFNPFIQRFGPVGLGCPSALKCVPSISVEDIARLIFSSRSKCI